MDFEERLMQLLDEEFKAGVDPQTIISAIELRLMALREEYTEE